jgi:hypothetical protein
VESAYFIPGKQVAKAIEKNLKPGNYFPIP